MSSESDGIIIREYQQSDWAGISKVHDAARKVELALTVEREAFRALHDTYEEDELFAGCVLVASCGNQIIGFIAYQNSEITWMYVSPQCCRNGVATRLMRSVLQKVSRPVSVSVLAGNEPAIKLYQKFGFEIQETKTGTLQGAESFAATGHLMVLKSN